jgi:hypothetical protein
LAESLAGQILNACRWHGPYYMGSAVTVPLVSA